jgi:hypothetical protein
VKKHLALIFFSTLLAGFSTASIVTFTDPNSAGFVTHVFFHISFFLTILGAATVAGVVIRQLGGGMYVVNLANSFRQGLFISILATSSIFLSRFGLFAWWTWGTLILFFVFLEIFLNLKS